MSMDEYVALGSNSWPFKDVATLIAKGVLKKGERHDTAEECLSVILMGIKELPSAQKTFILESISADLSKILPFVDDLLEV